jgi:imidazolonepropionase-like amidohydrolase
VMKRWWGTVVAATLSLPTVGRAQASVTAFVDVSVIPMDRERVLPHQTVVVQNGRITALGATREVHIPPGATRIDGQGKFLMPGLSDMHTHLAYGGTMHAERWLFLLFASGITTVRNVDYGHGGSFFGDTTNPNLDNAGLLRLKARAAAGELWSPRIYTSASGTPTRRRVFPRT